MKNISSIDLGSHTVRLLISQRTEYPELFRPLKRKRAYVHLAEGFEDNGKGVINPASMERAVKVLEDFTATAMEYHSEIPIAISTGVVREALNRDYFLDLIYDRTGLEVEVISGEMEALLTRKGVFHSMDIKGGSSVIFDLGGGTTEFISGEEAESEVISVPLGAVVLTRRFFTSDPPGEDRLEDLSIYVDEILEAAFARDTYSESSLQLVGSGGTVTTLAAMIMRIDAKEITPDRLNGRILKREHIEGLFSDMRSLNITERLKMPGLDQGRADVILAGAVAIIRIMHFFMAAQMTVSYSDILEGILINYLQGEKDE